MDLSSECERLDIVTDSYPNGLNLKESLQSERGVGKRLTFNDNTMFPTNFGSDFLRNSDNKREFYPYVVDKVISKCQFDEKIVVGTKNETTLTNYKGHIYDVCIPDCSHVEAYTRIIIHVMDCIRSGIQNVIVRSNDTDVIVLLITYIPLILENGQINVFVMCGVGEKVETLSINAFAQYIGHERCKELLFFHSFTSSDYTSSFFKVGKCKWWDAWLSSSYISKTFHLLSNCPSLPLKEEDIRVIEQVCAGRIKSCD